MSNGGVSHLMNTKLAKKLLKNIDEISFLLMKNHFSDYVFQNFGVKKVESKEELRVSFLVPLLKLLCAFLNTGKKEFLSIYLDERKRYSPHLSGLDVQLSYHQYVIAKDHEMLEKIVGGNSLSKEYWFSLHKSLLNVNEKVIKVLAVGDCLMNEIRVFSDPVEQGKDFSIDFRCIYLSAGSGGELDTSNIINYVNDNSIDIIAFSFFSFEVMPEYSRIVSHSEKMSSAQIINFCDGMISKVTDFIFALRKQTDKTCLIHSVSGLPLGRWEKWLPLLPALPPKKKLAVDYLNKKLKDLVVNVENVILIDEQAIADDFGIKHCAKQIAPQRIYKGLFHTSYFGKYLADVYIKECETFLTLKKCKVLLLDFDNTLWSGVMADGEVRHYVERQELLKSLKDQGIILVAVSKNSEENIRWNEMALKKEDFAFLQINWNPKADSINNVKKVLNLGKDSFVFIDDNRHERALVAAVHPEVTILDAELPQTWESLARLKDYPNTQATDEAKRRTALYQEQSARANALGDAGATLENLKLLELWYGFSSANVSDLDRILELVNRTNQFNLTTKRYPKAEVAKFLNDPKYLVLSASLGDKFGSLGLVAVCIIMYEGQETAYVDTFVMSCRAMGFALEKAFMYEIIKFLKAKGVKTLTGQFIPTDRNSPAMSFYEDVGFQSINTEGGYLANLEEYPLLSVDWLTKKADTI